MFRIFKTSVKPLSERLNMVKVNIIVSNNALFSTVFGPFDMFLQAGVFWNMLIGQQPEPRFQTVISSVDGKPLQGLGNIQVIPNQTLNDDDEFDLIIIPSEGMNIQVDHPDFQRRVSYLNTMHEKGATIASICTGAFVLAATGLLDGKVATTHWALSGLFSSMFPKVELNTDLLVVDNDDVLTAGGVAADQDLCMHLISRMCGQEIALQTARCTLVDLSHRDQAPFNTFLIEKQHGDTEVLSCQHLIETNLNKEMSVEYLAEQVHLTRRTLDRRFKKATGYSITSYVQRYRVEKAKHVLERNKTSFDELAFSLGYENVSYFRRLFKKYVGISPKEYRRRFYRLS